MNGMVAFHRQKFAKRSDRLRDRMSLERRNQLMAKLLRQLQKRVLIRRGVPFGEVVRPFDHRAK
jgi:hypothetical protein